jgi:hypothetical protein
MSTAFIMSGGVAGVSCGIVGFSFLGIGLNLKGKKALKQEKVNKLIVEKSTPLSQKVQKRKRVNLAKAPNLEISVINDSAIEEPPQLTPEVQRRKKTKAVKASNLEVSIIALLEEEEIKQKNLMKQ